MGLWQRRGGKGLGLWPAGRWVGAAVSGDRRVYLDARSGVQTVGLCHVEARVVGVRGPIERDSAGRRHVERRRAIGRVVWRWWAILIGVAARRPGDLFGGVSKASGEGRLVKRILNK